MGNICEFFNKDKNVNCDDLTEINYYCHYIVNLSDISGSIPLIYHNIEPFNKISHPIII